MTDNLPRNMAELLSDIEGEWKKLWQVIEQLTPEKMTKQDAGGWSPKDNLAHLAEWLKILMGYHMDRRPAHEVICAPSEVAKDWDMELINPVLFERNRQRDAGEILNELKSVYAGLTFKLRSMRFDELMKTSHADDPEQRTVLNRVLSNTTEHFAEHRATIEKML